MRNKHHHNHSLKFEWIMHATGAGVTAAIVGASAYLMYWPVGQESLRLQAGVRCAEEYLERHADVESTRDQLQLQLKNRQEGLAELALRVPTTANESEFLAEVAQLAQATGLEISHYNPGQPILDSTHGALEIGLKGEAPYANVCRFLAGLEELPRLCRTTTLDIVAPQAGSENCRVEITLQVFFIPGGMNDADEVENG